MKQYSQILAMRVPDYWQEHKPMEQWGYHWEVRANSGTESSPHWETLRYCDNEQQANTIKNQLEYYNNFPKGFGAPIVAWSK